MGKFPDTRVSLILRLAESADVEAWEEFTAVYLPALYHLALARGLNRTDAEDVTQEILMVVAGAVRRWQPDSQRARFRTWLCTIARNLIADYFAQPNNRKRTISITDSSLEQLSSLQKEGPSSAAFDFEYQRAVFRLAAERVRQRVTENSWIAFTSTTIDQAPVESVAMRLGMRPGSIYVARCRVLRLLREEARRIDSRLSGELPHLDLSCEPEVRA